MKLQPQRSIRKAHADCQDQILYHMLGEGGNRKGGLGQNFSRFKEAGKCPKFTKAMKDFRKTSATELKKMRYSADIRQQFLQRAAKNVNEAHYEGRLDTTFIDAVKHLETAFY